MKTIFIVCLSLIFGNLKVQAQFVIFNDNNVGTSQNQYIRISADVNAASPDLVPIGSRAVTSGQSQGGTHAGGNQWYLIDYPNNTGAATKGYVAAGTPLSLPECNQSYFTVTNSLGSSNIRIDHSTSANNVRLSNTPLVGWTGQKFALVSTTPVVQDNYQWYNIYLSFNCSQATGWIAGYSLGTSTTLGTVSTSNTSGVLTTPTLSNATNVGGTTATVTWTTTNINYHYKRYELYLNGVRWLDQSQLNYDGQSNTISKALTGLTAGTPYSCYVIAYNAAGCSSGQSNTINFTTTGGCSLSGSAAGTNVTCNGLTNGSITVTPSGGSAPYQYSKDGGANWQSSNTFSGLSAASYSATIKDANSCTSSNYPVTITEPSAISFTSTPTDALCCGCSNGSITVNASGGGGTYQYSNNNGPWQSSNTFSSLAAGAYSIKVKDANCVSASQSVSISEPGGVTISSAIPTHAACYGASSGSIVVTLSGGSAPYQYSKNNGTAWQSSNTFSGLAAGTYPIKVKDNNNCSSSSSVTITQPPLLSFTLSQGNATCAGCTDGSIAVNATGGTPAYQYSSNSGSTWQPSNTFSGLGAGSYSVQVKDANNCTASVQTVVITEPGGAVCYPTLTSNGLPQLLYPLQAEQADFTSSTNYGHYLSYGFDSAWGYNDCPLNSGHLKRHTGLDLLIKQPRQNGGTNVSAGKEVYASYDGVIKLVTWVQQSNHAWAFAIVIEHVYNNDTFTTSYLHILPLQQIWNQQNGINNGTIMYHVSKGDPIGKVANMPTYGSHLHYNIRKKSFIELARRGALPDPAFNPSCACSTDPVFPEYFINPETAIYTFTNQVFNISVAAIKSKLSSAAISFNRNGANEYSSVGFTDENGIANLKFSIPLVAGDSIKIEAANAVTTSFVVTSEMIANSKIEVPFLPAVNTGKIAHAYAKIQGNSMVTNQPTVQFKVTADNLVQYEIGKAVGDSVVYNTNLAQDSTMTISLPDTGRNYFNIRLISNLDTVSYLKYIDYTPTLDSTYQVQLNADATSENAYVYIDEEFVAKLQKGTNTITLYNGFHNIRLVKQNFMDSVLQVSASATINLGLNPLLVANATDSVVFNINNDKPHYCERGITVKRTDNNNASVSIKGYYDAFSALHLMPVSNTYVLRNLTATGINLDIAALTKQNNSIAEDSVYLLTVSNGIFTKNFLAPGQYDSENGKVAFNATLNRSFQFVLAKKQAPIMIGTRTFTMSASDSMNRPLTQFFSDPDSIFNDMTYQLTNGSTNSLNVSMSGGNVRISAMPGFYGNAFVVISATHDGLTVTDTVNINVIHPDGINPEPDFADVHVYPNPSKGNFVLSLTTSTSELVSIKVYNIAGDLVRDEAPVRVTGFYSKEMSLDQAMPRGIYVLQIKVGERMVSKRIDIQ